MNNKQSSVEWLAKSYVDLLTELNNDKISLKSFEIKYIEKLRQAKAMHKEEMVKFALFFSHAQVSRTNVIDEYNETFGGNQTPTPDPKLIDSMAMRYRHDFGLLSESEKESIRTTMKQLWEETAGLGFYKKS